MEKNTVTRLLIVEDDPRQRFLYRRVLGGCCDEIVEASDGFEAQEHDWTKFDVVLLDLLMPGMDGMATLAWAAQTFGEDLPPVVIFTALSNGPLRAIANSLPQNVTIQQKGMGKRESVLKNITETVVDAVANHRTS